MAQRVSDDEVSNQMAKVENEAHPYAFHVSGPRNLTTLNWRDLINSSWKDPNYKRTVIACFIQAVYLLELDRQENRSQSNALAPHWWIPFKYKLTKTLIDERDGSIFGAILEWDRSAAMADLVLLRPSGAPKAVLALRGTILKGPTIRRDIVDDLRFLAWESLKGSVRFSSALEALRSACDEYGSSNVCVAGHSLGAGFALQVGKALAKEGIYVDTHLFNPPSVSIAMSFRNIGEKADSLWKKVKKSFVSNSDPEDDQIPPNVTPGSGSGNWMTRLTSWKDSGRWVPHLYVNNSDYICCSYTDPDHGGDDGRAREGDADKENVRPSSGGSGGQTAAKLFVVTKEKQRFLEAHGLEQWWSSDAELQLAIHNSKLITRQLKSLYNVASSQIIQGKGNLK
ncbi:GDSL esterase/lipase At4g10955-like [Prosopis cineraria]|uniref:GDSL esterase/lipase At4g10955-like n=1 Tax=Prosopis cineraria TaxID=364024 RepID=UPI00240FCF69|nr:GDSL esterase/lipase At4g10955-like [Prosopis cineraria]